LFTILGVLVALYTAYAVVRGEVFVKHRAWGRTVYRAQSPVQFWISIAIYAGLSIMLCAVF
jgi:hypothetical protein